MEICYTKNGPLFNCFCRLNEDVGRGPLNWCERPKPKDILALTLSLIKAIVLRGLRRPSNHPYSQEGISLRLDIRIRYTLPSCREGR